MGRRIRTIKPEVLDSESMMLLSDAAWRLFVSMWTLADDWGSLSANEESLAAQVFWNRNTVPVSDLLADLEAAEHVQGYLVRGRRLVYLTKFRDHQYIEKKGKNRVPKYEESEALFSFRGTFPSSSPPLPLLVASGMEGKGEERKGEEGSGEEHTPTAPRSGGGQEPLLLLPTTSTPRFDFEAVYREHYPRKEGKKRGLELCVEQVRTQADFVSWTTAVKNFATLMSKERRPVEKQKHFDTFMGCWRDYIDNSIAVDPNSVMHPGSMAKGRRLF